MEYANKYLNYDTLCKVGFMGLAAVGVQKYLHKKQKTCDIAKNVGITILAGGVGAVAHDVIVKNYPHGHVVKKDNSGSL